jgi:hypothetical protein
VKVFRRALGLCLLACFACEGGESTQVIVTVMAEPRIREQATELRVTVRRNLDPSASVVYDDSHPARFPYVIALSPESQAAPSSYRLEVTASSASGALASARLESSYVSHQTRYVLLTLEDQCIGIVCGDRLTCHAGACVDSRVDPSELATDRAHAPRSVDLVDVTTPTADGDASEPNPPTADSGSKPDEAGPRQIEAGPPLLSRDAGSPLVDSGDQRDPAHPVDADTPPVANDAGLRDRDATVVPKPPDAATPVVPVTPPPVVPDAGPTLSAPCKPMGSWVVDYTETGGDCRLGDYQWLVAFHGKLTDIMVGETACTQAVDLTPDGCSMTYTLSCPAKDQTDPYEETSTLRMVAPDRMVGEVNQLFHRSDGDCRTLGNNDLRLVP